MEKRIAMEKRGTMDARGAIDARGARDEKDAAPIGGTVREQLPNALFRVELDTHHQVLAHATQNTGRNFIRLLAGDRVLIELSPRDPGRGRIVKRIQVLSV